MKDRYGKETLNVKELESQWYEKVEKDTSSRVRIEEKLISEPTFSESENCGHENFDLYVEEVVGAIERINSNSMPSPEEQVFNLMAKNNEKKWQEDCYIFFQKGW